MAVSATTDASLSLALTAAALSAAITARWMQWRQQKGHGNVSEHHCRPLHRPIPPRPRLASHRPSTCRLTYAVTFRQHETGTTASVDSRVDRGADVDAALDVAQKQAAQLERVLAASSSEKACAPGFRPSAAKRMPAAPAHRPQIMRSAPWQASATSSA